MRQATMVMWTVAVTVAVMTAGVQADDFVLSGDQQMEVVTSYDQGYLYDSSQVNILFGGSFHWLEAYDSSTVNISDGYIENLIAVDTSRVDISSGAVSALYTIGAGTVNMSGGYVRNFYGGSLRTGVERIAITGGWVRAFSAQINIEGDEQFALTSDLTLSDLAAYGVQAYDGTVGKVYLQRVLVNNTGSVNISGGELPQLSASDSSRVDINGGSVSHLRADDHSSVNISGGNITMLDAYNLRLGSERVTISDGSVEMIYAEIDVVGNEHFRLTSDLTLLDLVPYGVQADGDFVNEVSLRWLIAHDNSTVEIFGGEVFWLETHDNSTAIISAGGADNLNLSAFDDSVITLVGKEFVLDEGLFLDGDELLGTGWLRGEWLDGTPWAACIHSNDMTAAILLIPEPATILLLGLGGLALRYRKR